jgi:archaemetzincin
VGFLALAAAGEVDREAFDVARAALASRIGLPAEGGPPLPDPSYAYDAQRHQFSSTLIMQTALTKIPAGAEKLLVVTEADLFIPMLSFVFGQAQLDGPVAVLSFARLRQQFHGLPANRSLFLVRVAKEALHEIGHTFGLTHCVDSGCTMSLATSIRQLDAKGATYCESCAILIGEALRRPRSKNLDRAGGQA